MSALVAGPILAYRTWRLNEQTLYSWWSPNHWPPRVPFRAECTCLTVAFDRRTSTFAGVRSFSVTDEHRAPAMVGDCGIYAWRWPISALSTYSRGLILATAEHSLYDDALAIPGAVWLWGRVVEHTGGYRAEYAYPAKLWSVGTRIPARLAELAATYGVPAEIPKPLVGWAPPSWSPGWEALLDLRVDASQEVKKAAVIEFGRQWLSEHTVPPEDRCRPIP